MKIYRLGLIVFAIIVIIAQLILLTNTNSIWPKNAGSYIVIVAMIGLIISMIISIRHDKNNKHK